MGTTFDILLGHFTEHLAGIVNSVINQTNSSDQWLKYKIVGQGSMKNVGPSINNDRPPCKNIREQGWLSKQRENFIRH